MTEMQKYFALKELRAEAEWPEMVAQALQEAYDLMDRVTRECDDAHLWTETQPREDNCPW